MSIGRFATTAANIQFAQFHIRASRTNAKSPIDSRPYSTDNNDDVQMRRSNPCYSFKIIEILYRTIGPLNGARIPRHEIILISIIFCGFSYHFVLVVVPVLSRSFDNKYQTKPNWLVFMWCAAEKQQIALFSSVIVFSFFLSLVVDAHKLCGMSTCSPYFSVVAG